MNRGTAPCGQSQLNAKQVETSIPAPEEVPKWLPVLFPDAGSGAKDGHSHGLSPNTPSRWHHEATSPPCTSLRCCCDVATSHDICTTPKVASVVNVPPYTWSSHSGEGTAQASLNQDEALEDDFQTQHMPVHRVMWWEDDGHRSSAEGRLEYSGGSPGQQTEYQVDIGEEEEMLETVDPTWRTTCWLQLAVQGISDDEVPWYELVTPLMVGAEGMALSLAKHLLAIWRWSIKVQGQDICQPAPMVLNIGQFMMQEEVLEKVDDSLWFKVYSHTLQRVREATCGQRWQWPKGKEREVGVSPLVRAFWEETGIELTASYTKLCWELPPRGVFRRRERGAISHVITFLDDVAVRVPTLDAWDQFLWSPSVAMPWAATEVEQHGYHRSHAIDLSPVMPVTQFRVTDKEGTYLCVVRALVFEGSVLAYNPTRDEAKWVPTCGIANDLSWVEERSAVAFANYMPCIPQEAARIAELGACCLVGWPNDSSSEEEDDEQTEEEDGEQGGDEPEGDEHEEAEQQEEADPKLLSSGMALERGKTEQEVEPQGRRQLWELGSIMDEEEPLAFDDPWSDSDATVGGCSPVRLTPQELGSPQETAVEVHEWDSEVEAL